MHPGYLEKLENDSVFVIREAYQKFKNPAVLWSTGKDSTTLLWFIRKAFFGRVPFPVLHIDTSYKFREIYGFREIYSRKWGLNLIVLRNENALSAGMGPKSGSKIDCCNALKTEALKQGIKKYGFDAIFLGIRRDEHGIRAKERVYSPRAEDFLWNYRNQPAELWNVYKSSAEEKTHVRIHPLLSMTEIDIWRYIREESIPVCSLYFSKGEKRYRSIGCKTCCSPVISKADSVDSIIDELDKAKEPERAGRAQDKEDMYTMQKLRSLGYM